MTPQLRTSARVGLGTTARAALARGDVAEAARSFALAAGLAHDPGLEWERQPQAPLSQAVERLAKVLRAPRPATVRWWHRVGEGWLALGFDGLARASVERARRMIEGGTPAGWRDLRALVELSLRISPAHVALEAVAGDGAEVRPGMPVRMAPEPRADKQSRLGLVFGRGDPREVDRRVRRLHREADLVGLLLCTDAAALGSFSLVRHWYQIDEPRAAVEEFLTQIADRRLADWLPALQDDLAWCARSLYRLGDQVTAYACFHLAIALEEDVPSSRPPQSGDQPDPEPTTADLARDYCQRLAAVAPLLDSPVGVLRVFAKGFRAGDWLAEHGLEGCYFDYASPSRIAVLASRRSKISRQIHALGERSGWFLPLVDDHASGADGDGTDDHALEVAVAHAARPAALPFDGRRPQRRRGRKRWSPPPPLTGPPQRARPRRAQLPLGLVEAGGQAALEVGSGAPLLALGPPVDDQFLLAIAHELAAQGWAVLWLRQALAPLPDGADRRDGWHRITPGRAVSSERWRWLQHLTESEPLRQATQECLRRVLPPCEDPAADSCIEELLRSASGRRAAGAVLCEDVPFGERDGLKDQGARIVSLAADLHFRQPRDLRRAASLLDHVNAAQKTLRRAIRASWVAPEQSHRSGPAGGDALAGSLVRVDLPTGERPESALLAIICAGSLLEVADLCPRAPGEAPPGAGVDWPPDFTLEVRPRPDPGQSGDMAALSDEVFEQVGGAGGRTRPPPPPPPRSRAPASAFERMLASPWIRHGVLTPATDRPVCVLVSGSYGKSLLPLLRWFQPDGPGRRHGLITGTRSPSPADLGTGSLYRTFLVGQLDEQLLELLEIAAGIRVARTLSSDLGERGAVRLSLEEPAGPATRLVLWPAIEAARTATATGDRDG